MTRMWCVPVEYLCNVHLTGEHAEVHQEVGAIRGERLASVRGHAERGQVDTSRLQARHDTLAAEMGRRDMNHNSPLEYDDQLGIGAVDARESRNELARRCERCRKRIASALAREAERPERILSDLEKLLARTDYTEHPYRDPHYLEAVHDREGSVTDTAKALDATPGAVSKWLDVWGIEAVEERMSLAERTLQFARRKQAEGGRA